jgi:hypothetical protein
MISTSGDAPIEDVGREFSGFQEFRELLSEQQDLLAKALATKLLTLANLFVSLAQRMGLEVDRFGSSTKDGIAGLELS